MSHDYEKEYLVNLMKSVTELDYLCDATLVAGEDGEKFIVHRNIMMASSPYFVALLGPNYAEPSQEEIVLGKISSKTLQTIIHYCYSGQIEITDDTFDDIMAAASNMELVQLEQRCSDFWIEKLDVDNCVNSLFVADKYNLEALWKKSIPFIRKNLNAIPKTDLAKIDEKNVYVILTGDKISISEEDVFNFFVQWVRHDEAHRSQFVVTLANAIRLQHIPVDILREKVEPFYENYGCGKLVVDEYRNRAQDSEKLTLNRLPTFEGHFSSV